ncbi:MAG: serine/threonine-protein kinase [Gemmatimonadaceae bacterium]|nr:serine/threonine-protein kinase [Gemmatimonadaceae bacterium]
MVRPSLRQQLERALGGTYEIESEIGAGMSRVFKAREIALNRQVVIKVLAPELAGDISLERFRREIQTVATLQHPHIVPLLVAGEAEGLPYYTMPFVEGQTLRQRFGGGPLGLHEGFTIFRDVLKALSWAHAHRVVHRDIKPENVMLSGGVAVVTDFGIAKALQEAQTNHSGAFRTSVGFSTGTPLYMAPEQAAGDPAMDHRVDLYAVGIVAYEALGGVHPFADRKGVALMNAHANETPKHLKQVVPMLPSAICNVVMQTLKKDPAERPRSADEVLAVLEALATPRMSVSIPALTKEQLASKETAPVSRGSVTEYIKLPRGRVTLLLALAAIAAVLGVLAAWGTSR